MRVGVLGGGQLGWMLARAGDPLGIRCRFLDPSPEAPAGRAGELVVGAYDDPAALDRFADGLSLVTYEFENVPVGSRAATRGAGPRVSRRRRRSRSRRTGSPRRRFLESAGIPVSPWRPVASLAELERAVAELGCPAVLKTRRLGYDGKGQHVHPGAGVTSSRRGRRWAARPWSSRASCASTASSRSSPSGDRTARPPAIPSSRTSTRAASCRRSLAPAPGVAAALQARAEEHARQVLETLGYVGVLAIELFQVGDRLLANEMAPRVHNSGHWTIEGAETSQFENHLRAVAGLPLGIAAARGMSAMLNLIGALPDAAAVLAIPGAHLHLYGKAPRPGRKLGHVTLRADDRAELDRLRARLEPLIPPDPPGGS